MGQAGTVAGGPSAPIGVVVIMYGPAWRAGAGPNPREEGHLRHSHRLALSSGPSRATAAGMNWLYWTVTVIRCCVALVNVSVAVTVHGPAGSL